MKLSDIEENELKVETRYPTLRTIGSLLNMFAWIVGVAVIIAVVSMSSRLDAGTPAWSEYVLLLIGGAYTVLMLLAASEQIKVFLAIEENTRATEIVTIAAFEAMGNNSGYQPTPNKTAEDTELIAKLKTLNGLKEEGTITQELYEQKIKELVSKM